MPADNSFDVVNDFVHSIEASFEDMQSLCLGLAAENDKLRTELEKEAELIRHTERKYKRMLKEREDAHFAELEKERERENTAEMEIRRIKMWHPPKAPKPEPFCELRYGDVVFEIPYTLLHYMAGWLVCGMKGSHVPVNKAFGDVRQAFDYLERSMSFDTTSWTQEEKEFYEKNGVPIKKPELNWVE